MRVDLHPEARAEFRSAALWYEERRDGLGVEFVAAVDAALLRIGTAPKSFPRWAGTEKAPAVIRKHPSNGFHMLSRSRNASVMLLSWRSHTRNGVPFTGSHERANNPANTAMEPPIGAP